MNHMDKKVLIFGAGGRVGLYLTEALLRNGIEVIAVDFLNQAELEARINRVIIDSRVSTFSQIGQAIIYGDVDVLDEARLIEILKKENPDLVVNYAIPFTWDAAKKLPNYERISASGLGAFAAVQALAPKIIAQAIAKSNPSIPFVIGNLPDITIPIIHGLATHINLVKPIAGAGNVGLIEASLRATIAKDQNMDVNDLTLYLVCHHVHWVVPREPGYPNDAPFMLKVLHKNEDLTSKLGDLRELMNRSITTCYEPGAGFSSTTGLLASRLVLALLDDSNTEHKMHTPAANGLPGGYPVIVQNGKIRLNLPEEWQESELVKNMKEVHKSDGVEGIGSDGTIRFTQKAVDILKEEIGVELPIVVPPEDLERVAKEQIRVAQAAVE